MTLRIEVLSTGATPGERLVGRMQADGLDSVTGQIGVCDAKRVDLAEVTLVDVESVRFLIACEGAGIELLHCSRYIREWMRREIGSPTTPLNRAVMHSVFGVATGMTALRSGAG